MLAACLASALSAARASPAHATGPETSPQLPCAPACRVGYVCVQGQCVSACNPPCPTGTQCTERLTCEGPSEAEVTHYVAERKSRRERADEYLHDGFYMRLGLTLGFASDTADLEGVEIESSGIGGSFDFAIGGSLNDGLVMAFAIHMLAVPSPETVIDGDELTDPHSSLYLVLGVRLEFYPDPSDGLHFGATLGFSTADIELERDQFNARTSLAGLGAALTAGYDLWISSQWSVGLAAQLLYILKGEDDFGTHDVLIPMAVVSVALH